MCRFAEARRQRLHARLIAQWKMAAQEQRACRDAASAAIAAKADGQLLSRYGSFTHQAFCDAASCRDSVAGAGTGMLSTDSKSKAAFLIDNTVMGITLLHVRLTELKALAQLIPTL